MTCLVFRCPFQSNRLVLRSNKLKLSRQLAPTWCKLVKTQLKLKRFLLLHFLNVLIVAAVSVLCWVPLCVIYLTRFQRWASDSVCWKTLFRLDMEADKDKLAKLLIRSWKITFRYIGLPGILIGTYFG